MRLWFKSCVNPSCFDRVLGFRREARGAVPVRSEGSQLGFLCAALCSIFSPRRSASAATSFLSLIDFACCNSGFRSVAVLVCRSSILAVQCLVLPTHQLACRSLHLSFHRFRRAAAAQALPFLSARCSSSWLSAIFFVIHFSAVQSSSRVCLLLYRLAKAVAQLLRLFDIFDDQFSAAASFRSSLFFFCRCRWTVGEVRFFAGN